MEADTSMSLAIFIRDCSTVFDGKLLRDEVPHYRASIPRDCNGFLYAFVEAMPKRRIVETRDTPTVVEKERGTAEDPDGWAELYARGQRDCCGDHRRKDKEGRHRYSELALLGPSEICVNTG
ncbi:hypothetical protein V1477_000778, partial [Vespula maculifrons]